MPAQSPTLSPTLSAMVAALRGSSSGMFCSTLPTRSAPTSAALVKMPPPTRMNMASMAAPKPKPSRIVGASLRKINTTRAAPSSPRPTVAMPTWAPVRKAIRMAGFRPSERAAAATRTLARTASHMPRKPIRPEKTAPTRKAIEREILSVHSPKPVSPYVGSSKQQEEGDDGEDREGPELPGQVGRGPFLDGERDLLHVRGALAGREDFPPEDHRHDQGEHSDQPDDRDEGEVRS